MGLTILSYWCFSGITLLMSIVTLIFFLKTSERGGIKPSFLLLSTKKHSFHGNPCFHGTCCIALQRRFIKRHIYTHMLSCECGLPLWRRYLSAFDTLYFWTYCCSRNFCLRMPLLTVPVSGMVLGFKHLVEIWIKAVHVILCLNSQLSGGDIITCPYLISKLSNTLNWKLPQVPTSMAIYGRYFISEKQ